MPRALRNHPRITFREVRYTLQELEIFKEKISYNIFSMRTSEGYLLHSGLLSEMGINIEKNQVEVRGSEEFDIGLIHAFVPEDAVHFTLNSKKVKFPLDKQLCLWYNIIVSLRKSGRVLRVVRKPKHTVKSMLIRMCFFQTLDNTR